MKNIQTILTAIFLATFAVSCDTDGGTSEIETIEGAILDLNKAEDYAAILNLSELNAGRSVEIAFTVDQQYGDVASADLIGFYRSGDDLFGPVVIESGITEFPMEIILTSEEIIAAFSELNSSEDFELGDELILTTKLYLADGRTINLFDDEGNRLYGSDIHTSTVYNAQITYPVSCPSDLGGTYNVISDGTSTDPGVPGPAVNFPYTVTITDNGGGNYSISDGVAGLYINWYTQYGYSFETAGSFSDVCGTLSGSWVEAFGCQVDLTGTVNEDGTLNIHWENCFGDKADAVYTPQ